MRIARPRQNIAARFDGNDRRAAAQQLSSRDPRAGADVEHDKTLERTERVVNAVGVRRPSRVVLIDNAFEEHHAPILTDSHADIWLVSQV